MPLLGDLGLQTQRTPTVREADQQYAQRQDLLSGVGPRLSPSQKGSVPDITALLDTLKNQTLGNLADLPKMTVPALNATAEPLISRTGWFPKAPSEPTSSGIIGTKNYQVGRGDPSLRSMAWSVAQSMGWDQTQFAAWDALINAESGWRPNAQNPTSTAYGLGQFLNSTWRSYGSKTSDPLMQLQYMAKYIKGRYGSPQKALAFHARSNYY